MGNIDDIALIVPAYSPSRELVELVGAAKEAGFKRIILVDDGSDLVFAPIFDECVDKYGAELLRHSVNEGKGRALKTGFLHFLASSEGRGGVTTADSDGQHLISDIKLIAEALADSLLAGKHEVVLGSRDFDQAGLPWKSRLGNKATTGIVRLFYGKSISDTQTGLRGIPRVELNTLVRVKGERFEYEMNALLDSISRKVGIRQVPITTVYHDVGNSQSHFRPIRDSLQVWLQVFKFSLSSLLGAAVDLGAYALIIAVFFSGAPQAVEIAIAVIVARILSASTNYTVNRRFVFHDEQKAQISGVKYALLALALVGLSAAGSIALTALFDGHAVWAKICVDVALYILSFIIQKRWVFSQDKSLEV